MTSALLVGCDKNQSLSPLAPGGLTGGLQDDAPQGSAPRANVGPTGGIDETAVQTATSGRSVQPSQATLAPGATQQFTGSGFKGTVRWRATGGTITSTGLYKAGGVPGSFTVTASARNGSASASVVIAVPTTNPVINPGDSIQDAVNAHPAGTTFTIKSGVHRRQTITPKHGMTFMGESGAVLDGEGVATRAFTGQLVQNVTIRGLRITGYVPPNTTAAVDGIDSTGWIIENNEIDHNSNGANRAYGLRLGDGMIVRSNKIHDNGWVGIAGYQADNVLIEYNEIYANPPAAFDDTLGEAANMKLFLCGNITVRDNFVHDGPMIGIWFDTMKPDNKIELNRVINHGGAGIWWEVSYRGTIWSNYVENAGYSGSYSVDWLHSGGIQVTNSPDVTVMDNTVVASLNGIIGHQAAGYPSGTYGVNELRNLLVQGNIVVMPRGQVGIARNIPGDAVYDSWNNRFSYNRYELHANASPFFWKGRTLTIAEWKAGPGATDAIVP